MCLGNILRISVYIYQYMLFIEKIELLVIMITITRNAVIFPHL